MAWPKGKPRSEETREKISRTKTGRKLTPEHRRRISRGAYRRWAREKAGMSPTEREIAKLEGRLADLRKVPT